LNELVAQVKNLWNQMDTTRRIFAAVVLLLVIVTIILMAVRIGTPKYELLYARLSEQDRSEIIVKLEELKVPYRTTAGGGLEVPNAVSVRASLLKEGIPNGGVVGWEIFDQNSFSATDFSNQINRQRAIAGELTRTLQRLDGIVDAKILLNIPDPGDYLFSDDKPEGTASVQLQLRSQGVLSQSQVEAIANLLAASCGIKPANVTIVDNYANDLTAMLRSKRGAKLGIGTATELFAAQTEYESQLEKRIETMLSKVFGFNKSVVRVNAELDLDYQEIKSEKYGDTGVPRSEQERSEKYEGAGGDGYGIPGTDTNITQYKADDDQGNRYRAEKEERIVNYEISKVEEFRISAPGKVRRLTVGVWVDGNLPDDIRQKVANTVGAAVGLSENRGDQLTVETIEFTKPTASSGQKSEIAISWQTVIQYLMLGLFLVALLWMLKKIFVVNNAEPATIAGTRIDQLIDGNVQQEQAAGLELTQEEKNRIDKLNTLEKIALEKPDEVAALLKSWLSEEY